MRINPFPTMGAFDRVQVKSLCRIAKTCVSRGWSYGTAGNFSWQSQKGQYWVSPTDRSKDLLSPENFVLVDSSGKVVGQHDLAPSGEFPIHLGIYKGVAGARCVVHTHPPNLVMMAKEPGRLTFEGQEMQKHLGCQSHLQILEIPVFANLSPQEMATAIDELPAAIDQRVPVIVFSRHGVYGFSDSPERAFTYIEALEFLCRTNN